jgi:hypothetical protein
MSLIISMDVSGNYGEKEGFGTTGICIVQNNEPTELRDIKAKDFASQMEYFHAHIFYVDYVCTIVYETYKLQAGKAMQQSWSSLDTPQLIGMIRYTSWGNDIPCIGQDPSIKPRWSDDYLVRKGYLEEKNGRYYFKGKMTNTHQRDSLRHALHYLKYGGK